MNLSLLYKIKYWIRERSFRNHRQINVNKILDQCCFMRGNQLQLIHRTLHELGWFSESMIFKREDILKELKEWGIQEFDPYYKKIQAWHYIFKNPTLSIIQLFHEWCYELYIKHGSID